MQVSIIEVLNVA